MARPTKPKDLKPKAEGEVAPTPIQAAAVSGGAGGVGLDLKFIVTLLAIVISSVGASVGSIYFLAPIVLVPAIVEQIPHALGNSAEGGHGETAHASKVGLNLELDEFMVNLKTDPNLGGNQYLRTKMSLNISVPPEEDCYSIGHHAMLPADANGQIVGAAVPVDRELLASGGGAPADPVVGCLDAFRNNMGKYVPTMRDVINAALMKRTAGNLSTLEGQEALKDDIMAEVNQFLDSRYKVVRINFEDFIIQR